jgi:hypothetical protein
LADVTVMDAFESRLLDLPDFYFTGDDYRYRFEPEAKERFLGLLRDRFNSGVRYTGRVLKWDTLIEQKTVELCRFVVGHSVKLDFSNSSPSLRGTDNLDLRRRILSLSQPEARRLRIGKSMLYYLQRNVRTGRSLKLYGKTRQRIESNMRAMPQ